MKKTVYLLIITLVLFLIMPITSINADIGPKPTLDIEVVYKGNHDLQIEFIRKGNINTSDLREFDEYFSYDEVLFNFLVDKDFEGYVSAYIYGAAPYGIRKVTEDNKEVFKATYLYPNNAKILIHDKTTNQIIITKEFSQKAFNAKVVIDLKDILDEEVYLEPKVVSDTVILVKETHQLTLGISLLVLRIVLTIGIELFVLFLFRYKLKNSYLFVGLANLVTQITLSIILFIFVYTSGTLFYITMLILGELIVISAEAIFYLIFLKEHSKKRAILYALIANLLTIAIGLLI